MAEPKRKSGVRRKVTPASTCLSAKLNSRVDELRRLVPRALKSWDATAIHQARVTTRRLKAAIDVLEPVLPEARRRRFAKGLKRLRRALGPLRDTDVMLEHLAEIRARGRHSAAADWLSKELLQRRLDQRRECIRKHPVKAVLDELGSWWSLEQDVVETEQAARSLLRRAAPMQLRAFSDRADKLAAYRQNRQSGELAANAENDDDVHALRVAGKLLRYTLELSGPTGYSMSGSVLRSFKKLQDALGTWHDYVVLGETALRCALKAQLAVHHEHLYGQMLDLARLLCMASERHLDKFSNLWRERGSAVAQSITEIFRATGATPATVESADDQKENSSTPPPEGTLHLSVATAIRSTASNSPSPM